MITNIRTVVAGMFVYVFYISMEKLFQQQHHYFPGTAAGKR
ncbi:MAG TPA: hypothetical protein VK766_08200 [Cytophagaceae bacterium]|nr:hypothetical protein [Cytophagaceae bacterium]